MRNSILKTGIEPANYEIPLFHTATNEEFKQKWTEVQELPIIDCSSMYYVNETNTLYKCVDNEILCALTEVAPKDVELAGKCIESLCGQYDFADNMTFENAIKVCINGLNC